ncbi:MAG: zinc-dependent peptidase [Pirellulaceae bacterium]
MVFGNWFRSGRRQQLLAEPLPAAWRRALARNVAVFRRLSGVQQQRLVAAARIIAAERRFVGCQGLVVTDEMKITIAGQAALLLLGEEGYYFDRVTSFLLYPFKMVLPAHGVRPMPDEEDLDERVILGQAHQQGEIVLSWPDVLAGGRVAGDGENVVLHELAHHLDGLDGQMGGSPPGLPGDRLDHFQRVIDQTLEQLRSRLAEDFDSILSPNAAESAAELFAYATECFFEQPRQLADEYAPLFACLREFYKVDPSAWFVESATSTTPVRHDAPPADDEPDEPPAAHDLPPLHTADQYFARGQEYFSLGEWNLAAADFNRSVRMDPADQEAVLWRGRAYLYQDFLDAALADADRACRLDRADPEAHALRGMCLAALGRYPDALAAFVKGASNLKDDAEAIFLRGLARYECGRYREALADFCDLTEMQPDDAEAWRERSRCHEQLGNPDQAARDLAKARELGFQEDESGP